MPPDVFISVDIEADGPIPGDYSMSSFGACVVGDGATFYRELKPITDRFDPEAAVVAGLDRAKLIAEGAEPSAAMRDFNDWIREVSRKKGRPVFVGFNATFDWMFVHWYFIHFVGKNPFGIAGLDIKAYYMGALGKEHWSDTAKRNMDPRFLSNRPHTHNALDDAREQAEIFARIRDHVARSRAPSV